MAECPGVMHLADMRDGWLARVRIPGGRLLPHELAGVANIARMLGNGQIDITNRANIQIRGLEAEASEPLAQLLACAGIAVGGAVSERLRNIVAGPLAGISASELLDVSETVEQIDDALQQSDGDEGYRLSGLSPKFSFVIDGGGPLPVHQVPYDIGLFACRSGSGVLFRIGLAGERTEFAVKPADACAAALTLALATARHGESNKGAPGKAGGMRMAALVTQLGIDALMDSIAGAVDVISVGPTGSIGPEKPVMDLSDPCAIGVFAQQQPGLYAVGIGIPLSRMTADDADWLAQFADGICSSEIRMTPWQSVMISNVPLNSVDDLQHGAKARGWFTDPEDVRIRVVACAGSTGCVRTESDTRAIGRALIAGLGNIAVDPSRPQIVVHVSGCVRGCARALPSDLLLLANDVGTSYDIFEAAQASDAGGRSAIARDVQNCDATEFVAKWLGH